MPLAAYLAGERIEVALSTEQSCRRCRGHPPEEPRPYPLGHILRKQESVGAAVRSFRGPRHGSLMESVIQSHRYSSDRAVTTPGQLKRKFAR